MNLYLFLLLLLLLLQIQNQLLHLFLQQTLLLHLIHDNPLFHLDFLEMDLLVDYYQFLLLENKYYHLLNLLVHLLLLKEYNSIYHLFLHLLM
jgi:hypothetical protein